uniref:Lipoprotein n=1 Tax=uncultured Caudovirales phage TaxID=2100421 RepID=A0A6J5L292_9CAUD|nr:hypothetical protein UFOVP114_35 [uncultured Caudovirales phage]
MKKRMQRFMQRLRAMLVYGGLAATAACSPKPLQTVLHVVNTGDPAAPFALDRHDRLCVSKNKPPTPDCNPQKFGYKDAKEQ